MISSKQYKMRLAALCILLIVCLVVSLGLGRFAVDPITVIKILFSKLLPIPVTWSTQAEKVILSIRFPRVFMGCFIGAGLSCAGCAFQGIFQNPMASPDMLGASNGAGFGAAAGLLIGLSYQGTSFLAFIGGLCAVNIVMLISFRIRGNQTTVLLLSGIMVGSLASAGVSYIKLVADQTNTLPAITYWLMGSLASIRNQDMLLAGPLIITGVIPILLLRWKINVLAMGDEEAISMGINASHLRLIVVLCATLITAACVSVSGMIGWVGLVIPHFTRMLVSGDFRRSMPACLLLGGSFMIIVDNFARLITTSEIPIGILTAFVGAPFFLYMIMKEGNKL